MLARPDRNPAAGGPQQREELVCADSTVLNVIARALAESGPAMD
jgi:hypothetical protein